MTKQNLNATIQNNYENSPANLWFFQESFKEFIFFNILWIILLLLLFTYFLRTISSLYYKNNRMQNLLIFILFAGMSILFAFGLYYQNKKTLMYISYPNGSNQIRSSIEMFIDDAKKMNASVKDYDTEYTYVYFKNNILDLLKTNEDESELYDELEVLFQKYKYIPTAIIKENSLKSLTDGSFIRMK